MKVKSDTPGISGVGFIQLFSTEKLKLNLTLKMCLAYNMGTSGKLATPPHKDCFFICSEANVRIKLKSIEVKARGNGLCKGACYYRGLLQRTEVHKLRNWG